MKRDLSSLMRREFPCGPEPWRKEKERPCLQRVSWRTVLSLWLFTGQGLIKQNALQCFSNTSILVDGKQAAIPTFTCTFVCLRQGFMYPKWASNMLDKWCTTTELQPPIFLILNHHSFSYLVKKVMELAHMWYTYIHACKQSIPIY